ncbi:hypothetical protein ACFLEY_22810 [Bradyrhizobium sp. YCK136]|uniref:hypothetical protein n=1 Tax=Bradyrhizobium sp. YCK136 TaxID=3351346 RepID=UPI0037CA32AA
MSSWALYDGRNVMRAEEVEHRFGKKLGRCPFCKSAWVGLYMGPFPHVTCLDCGADGPLSKKHRGDDMFVRQHIAIDQWNLAA